MIVYPEIPGYKIINVISDNGVARVHLAIQEKLNRKAAIKILNPFFFADQETAQRFRQEAKTAAMLNHSNIVHIYDTGAVGEYQYIVMEYLQDSLRERMKLESSGMKPVHALSIVEEMIKALDYAHFRGVYHRDIKPENIMFRQDGVPILVDFGIAFVYDTSVRLTGSDTIMGTVYYMSPEQCNSLQDLDGRTDIYSLGVVLYEMLTGKKPYTGGGLIAVLRKHALEAVPKLPEHLSRLQPLIDCMMAKDRNKRISTAPEFAYLLHQIKTNNGGIPTT